MALIIGRTGIRPRVPPVFITPVLTDRVDGQLYRLEISGTALVPVLRSASAIVNSQFIERLHGAWSEPTAGVPWNGAVSVRLASASGVLLREVLRASQPGGSVPRDAPVWVFSQVEAGIFQVVPEEDGSLTFDPVFDSATTNGRFFDQADPSRAWLVRFLPEARGGLIQVSPSAVGSLVGGWLTGNGFILTARRGELQVATPPIIGPPAAVPVGLALSTDATGKLTYNAS